VVADCREVNKYNNDDILTMSAVAPSTYYVRINTDIQRWTYFHSTDGSIVWSVQCDTSCNIAQNPLMHWSTFT